MSGSVNLDDDLVLDQADVYPETATSILVDVRNPGIPKRLGHLLVKFRTFCWVAKEAQFASGSQRG
eukprot:g26586.t1